MSGARGHSASRRAPLVLGGTLILVGIAVALTLIIWDAWVVNYDGGAYLVLAERLRTGLGYTFPDGSPAAFRGPMYPLSLSVAWLLAPVGEQTAIWVSRSVVAIGSLATAGIVWLAVRRALASATSGLAAAIQPLIFASGAFFFVPDGMAAVFMLVGTAIVAPGIGSKYGRWRPWVAGFVFGIGTLTKETAVFGLLVGAALAFNVWRRGTALAAISRIALGWALPVGIWSIWVLAKTDHLPAPGSAATGIGAWLVLLGGFAVLLGFWSIASRHEDDSGGAQTEISVPKALLSAGVLAIAPLVVLLIVVSPAVQTLGESHEVVVGAGGGSAGDVNLVPWFALSTLALIAVALTVRSERRFQLLPPMGLVAMGLSLVAWGAVSGFGMRNGAILAYGLAWLLGVVIADWIARKSAAGAWRVAAVALVGGFVGLNMAGLVIANEWVDQDAPSWNAPGVKRAAAWLSDNGGGKITSGTPVFINYLAFRAPEELQARLVPIFESNRTEDPVDPTTFDRRVWWAAHIPESPIGNVELGRTYGRKFISSILEEDLLDELRESQAGLLVVTGIAQSDGPYEGVMLVPYLEAATWAERVYTSAPSELPYWILIYEITGDPEPMGSPQATVYVPFPPDDGRIPSGPLVIGPSEYEDMIRSIVEVGS